MPIRATNYKIGNLPCGDKTALAAATWPCDSRPPADVLSACFPEAYNRHQYERHNAEREQADNREKSVNEHLQQEHETSKWLN